MSDPRHIAGAFAIREIAATVQRWIDWNGTDRARKGLTTDEGTAIMAVPVPSWPTHGQMHAWIEALNGAADLLVKAPSALVVIPHRFVWDEMSIMDRVWIDGEGSIEGRVTALSFSNIEGPPVVEVSWLHNGEAKSSWFASWRLTRVSDDR